MPKPMPSRIVCTLILVAVSFVTTRTQAQTFNTLTTFSNSANGLDANSAPVMDGNGNLFGTTNYGGNASCFLGCGTVFELSPAQGGGWSLTTIYTFQGGGDGFYPVAGSALLIDAAGNLYGETVGNDSPNCPSIGCGTVFKLSLNGSGEWTKSTVYSFQGTDGGGPIGGMTMDLAGNLFGVTAGGGGSCPHSSLGCGIVFKLHPQSDGTWVETILHQFGSGSDGYNPRGIVLAHGNLFGVTYSSPSSANCPTGCGTVFELTRDQTTGNWTETILHMFQGPDGELPLAPPVVVKGVIYGTTQGGGVGSQGVIYKMASQTGGGWQFRLIHAFSSLANGQGIVAPVTLDAAGNVYGTTTRGGNHESACEDLGGPGCGLVYKLVRPASGPWTYQVLYSFTGTGDGNNPQAGVTLDGLGNVFGTTGWTDNSLGGTVFEITP